MALVLCASCSPEPNTLTCALLSSPNNCFAVAVSAVASCLPDNTSVGLLSTDRTSCTFSNGSSIQFGAALANNTVFELSDLEITVYDSNNVKCGHIHDMRGSLNDYLFVNDVGVGRSYENDRIYLECPAVQYSSDVAYVMACSLPAVAPSDAYSIDGNGIIFSLAAAGASTPLFTCR